MKICWIGTSYFSMAQAYDERGVEKDFVYYIAQRHPKHQFLNLSIPGVGMDHFPVRLEYGIAQDCTHFFIELPGGLRKNFISSVEETVPHPRYLRIHEYENGQRTYVQNNKDQLLLDEWIAQVDHEELRELFARTMFPHIHDKSFWDMIGKFAVMIDSRFNRCQWIHNCINIQARLESLGKTVTFYEWGMNNSHNKSQTHTNTKTGKQVFNVCCASASKVYNQLNILSDPWPLEIKWMLHDELIQPSEVDCLIEKYVPESDPQEQNFREKMNKWQETNYYDGSHLNDEALRKYSSTFDQIIWDWENDK